MLQLHLYPPNQPGKLTFGICLTPGGTQTTVTGTVTNPTSTGAPTGTVTLMVSHLLLGSSSVSTQLLITDLLADAMVSTPDEKNLLRCHEEPSCCVRALMQNASSASARAGLFMTTHIHLLPLMPLRSSCKSCWKAAFIAAYPAGEFLPCTIDSNTLFYHGLPCARRSAASLNVQSPSPGRPSTSIFITYSEAQP